LPAKFGSASADIARRSFEKPHEARFDFVEPADQLHAPFDLAFPAFRRLSGGPRFNDLLIARGDHGT